MVENYSQKIDHTTLEPGIYLRASHAGVFVWDFRLVHPNSEEKRIPGEAIHSIEHLLAAWLRPVLDDDYIGVYPMGCGTGITVLTRENTNMYNNFQGKLLYTVVDMLNNSYEVPFATEKECGSYKYHSFTIARQVLLDFLRFILSNFLFITPMECERKSLQKALERHLYFSYLDDYISESGIGKANVSYTFGKKYNQQKYVVLMGFAGTCDVSLSQGDIIFPTKSKYDDVSDKFGILSNLTSTNTLLGKDDYLISTNDSFADRSFVESLGYDKNSKVIFDMEANALASIIKYHSTNSTYPKLIVAKMISDSVFSTSQGEDFEIFKNGRDFSSMLLGCLQLSEYFTRIDCL